MREQPPHRIVVKIKLHNVYEQFSKNNNTVMFEEISNSQSLATAVPQIISKND